MMSPIYSTSMYDANAGVPYYATTTVVPSPPSHEVIANRVFVGGFAPQTTEQELHSFFEQYVHVRDTKIVKSADGNGKSYGFVTVECAQDADYLRNLEPEFLEFNGKTLNLQPALRKLPPKYTQEYAIATPNGLVSPGNYSYPQYSIPPPTPYLVFPQPTGAHYVYNIHPQQMAPQPLENTQQMLHQHHDGGFYTEQHAINNRSTLVAGQEIRPLGCSTPVKSQAPATYPVCYVGQQSAQMPITQYYAASEGVYASPQSSQSQEMYYSSPKMAGGDAQAPMRLNQQQRAFNWNTPSRDAYSGSPTMPRTPQRARPGPVSTPPPHLTSVNRNSSAVRRINVFGEKEVSAQQAQALGTPPRPGRRNSTEAPLPVKLEIRPKGPDGRFKTNDNSKHFHFIRTPPSDTKSLPPGRPPRVNGRGSKCVQSLAGKFANLETKDKENNNIGDLGDHGKPPSAPVTPRHSF